MKTTVIPRLVLASASPRRLELLRQAGIDPEVRASQVDETPQPDEDPIDYARRMSLDKARAGGQGRRLRRARPGGRVRARGARLVHQHRRPAVVRSHRGSRGPRRAPARLGARLRKKNDHSTQLSMSLAENLVNVGEQIAS